jgi:hypothetical protein
MQRLCCCYLTIYRQTDRQTNRLTEVAKLRCATLTLLRFNHPPAADANDCCTFMVFHRRNPSSYLLRKDTTTDSETPSSWYTQFNFFNFLHEMHSTVFINQCYLRLNAIHLSKFNRKFFKTTPSLFSMFRIVSVLVHTYVHSFSTLTMQLK